LSIRLVFVRRGDEAAEAGVQLPALMAKQLFRQKIGEIVHGSTPCASPAPAHPQRDDWLCSTAENRAVIGLLFFRFIGAICRKMVWQVPCTQPSPRCLSHGSIAGASSLRTPGRCLQQASAFERLITDCVNGAMPHR
jgi:hypothetical protein